MTLYFAHLPGIEAFTCGLMNQLAKNTTVELVAALLNHYSFDLGSETIGELIMRWLSHYPANWVRAAVIEALYRGRYKAVSVDQMLAVWQRKGVALHYFNHEFERLVCADLPHFGIAAVNSDDQSDVNPATLHLACVPAAQTASNATPIDVIEPHPVVVSRGQKDPVISVPANGKITHAARSHNGTPSPIVRFSPSNAIASDFYSKLKAISRLRVTSEEADDVDG